MAAQQRAGGSPLTSWARLAATGAMVSLLLAGCSGPAAPPPTASASRQAAVATVGSGERCRTRAWPYSTPIVALQLVGASGWAVGAAGVLTSTDGGAHWTLGAHPARHDLGSVDFVDSDHGWVVGPSGLLATTDGGRRWRSLPEPGCDRIRMVHFITPTEGYAVAGGATRGVPGALPTSGGTLLASTDAGRSWQRLPAPVDVQSVCFQDTRLGWLGTLHGIYGTSDGGRRWRRVVATPGGRHDPAPVVGVQCGDGGVAWALAIGPGAASSQMPHIGWRVTASTGMPLFAEQYFPHPAVRVRRSSPGSYPGPFSAVDATTAAFIDNCPACRMGAVPWLLAERDGHLVRRGDVAGLTSATAADFTTTRNGCVAGRFDEYRHRRLTVSFERIVCTNDSGGHWRVAWQRRLRQQ